VLNTLIFSEKHCSQVNSLLKYKWFSKKPSLFRSLTGLKVTEFDSFYTQANTKYKDYEAKRLAQANRKHKVAE
jgi:hypothetical protein